MSAATRAQFQDILPYHSTASRHAFPVVESGSENGGDLASSFPGHLLANGDSSRPAREQFNVNTQTGGMSFTLPIHTSPGRSGFGPSLALIYDSGSASTNGVFGLGWRLDGVESISRKTSQAIPEYDNDRDVFVHSHVGELVPLRSSDNTEYVECDREGYRVRRYRPRVERDPICIERWGSISDPGDIFWKVIQSDNTTSIYGRSTESRIAPIEASPSETHHHTFSWLVCDTYDSHGNYMVHSYKPEDRLGLQDPDICLNQRYLKSIKYGNRRPNRDVETWEVELLNEDAGAEYWMFEVVLDYGDQDEAFPTCHDTQPWALRPDPFALHTAGFEVRTHRRCRRVLMFHHIPEELQHPDYLVASTAFHYEEDSRSGTSLLKASTMSGHTLKHGERRYSALALPPVEFEYQEPPDLDNLQTETVELNLSGLTTGRAQWVDLHADGVPGVLVDSPGGGWYYHPNQSRGNEIHIGGPWLQDSAPRAIWSNNWRFEDVNKNGNVDVVCVSQDQSLRGFYANAGDGKWDSFAPFTAYPTRGASGRSWTTYKVDLTGNGQTDILYRPPNNDLEWLWHESLGPYGYGEERRTTGAPRLPFDPTGAILVSDMTGDGLADIVSVHSTSISYWPNMGYGRFGQAVPMQNSPRFPDAAFNPLRIRMADLTGSGGSDLVYLLPQGGALVYYNQWGNGWGTEHFLPCIPPLNRFSAADIFDIGGKGTQWLCWTSDMDNIAALGISTKVDAVDMTGGCKPNLLTGVANGIGGETTVEYRSSTSYALEDKLCGHPWATRLPFAVNCVKRTTFHDHVAQTSHTTHYRYHNGYYDYRERQFRGFQRVEERTTEEFAVGVNGSQIKRPPTVTRSWFYTGLERLDAELILPGSPLTQEPLTRALSSTIVPQAQTEPAIHEAYVALVGRLRQQEIYGDDGTDKTEQPYVVIQQGYEVVRLQEACPGRNGISRVNPRETVKTMYEREKGNDPRVEHTLVLKVDAYGNVERETVVNYGKLQRESLDGQDWEAQRQTTITYTETRYTNAVENTGSYFHKPVVAKVSQYRVYPGSNLANTGVGGRYRWDQLSTEDGALLSQSITFPMQKDCPDRFQSLPKEGYKVLYAKEITLYRQLNLRGLLPLCQLDPYSVKHQTYKLCFTQEFVQEVLDGTAVDGSTIKEELQGAGYVKLGPAAGGHKNEWWVPSTRHGFHNDQITDDELGVARRQFYIPNVAVDPFQTASYEWLDPYKLFVVASLDTVGNTTKAVHNYSLLQPIMMTDANGNRKKVARDSLGAIVGVATMGKQDEKVGDCLDDLDVEITTEDLESFTRNPSGPEAANLLGYAGTRTIYHRNRYREGQSANFRADLVRDQHYRDGDAQIRIQITYVDGTGNDFQKAAFVGHGQDRGWQFSGCVLRDRQGDPVKQLVPFFSASHEYHSPTASADRPATITFKDPVGRRVGELNADHTWSKRRITPWRDERWDAGDTILVEDPSGDEDVGIHFQLLNTQLYQPTWHCQRTGITGAEADAARKSEVYANTPMIVHCNAQGKDILIEQRGSTCSRDNRKVYDGRGNIFSLIDACNRSVTRTWYDCLNRPLLNHSIDSGKSWQLVGCDGAPVRTKFNTGPWKRVSYDALRRIKFIELESPGGRQPPRRLVWNVYGDETCVLDATKNNLRGKLYQCHDQSGIETHVSFDYKGNCLESSVQHAINYDGILDWAAGEIEMEPEMYTTRFSFNAVGHTTRTVTASGHIVRNTFDVAGRLTKATSQSPLQDEAAEETGERVPSHTDPAESVVATSSVDNIQYSEDGKMSCITYGNGSQTTHIYNAQTRRIDRTTVTRARDGAILQDLAYTYDCLGKVVKKTDGAQQTVYFQNEVVTPTQHFEYDAFGQLVSATGREQVDGSTPQLKPYSSQLGAPNVIPGNGEGLVEYIETYAYDRAGNITKVEHQPTDNTKHTRWRRTYTYEGTSNRLLSTQVGSSHERYEYEGDAGINGCMTSMPGYTLEWDCNNRLRSLTTQRVGKHATPEKTWYVYNARGERVRKVTNRGTSRNGPSQATKRQETRYLAQCDLSATYHGDGSSMSLRTTTKIAADAPLVIVESSTSRHLARYQISESLELGDQADVVSYEEFSPYGATTYHARRTGAPRKYRFASYQRDGESGLYLCGARYYAPWLGRWTSADPLGTVDGPNLYAYVQNDPVALVDHRGTSGKNAQSKTKSNSSQNTEKQVLDETPLRRALNILGHEMLRKAYNVQPMTLGTQGAGDKQVTGISGKSRATATYQNEFGRPETMKSGTYGFEIRVDIESPKKKKQGDSEGASKAEEKPKGFHINVNYGMKGHEQKYCVKNLPGPTHEDEKREVDRQLHNLTRLSGWNKEEFDEKDLQQRVVYRDEVATKVLNHFLSYFEPPPTGEHWVPYNFEAILLQNRNTPSRYAAAP
ncbi:hypothetical protein EYZ11_006546 [Aspergillus tanneri]|nr:hypothetical protein EYZ11_006546 [Aspergillus tanneri]